MIAHINILSNIYLNIENTLSELYIVDEPLIKVPKIKHGSQLTDLIDQRDCLRGSSSERVFSLAFSFDHVVPDETLVSVRLDNFEDDNGSIVLKKFMKKTILTEYFKAEYFIPKNIPIHENPVFSNNFLTAVSGHSFYNMGKVITNGPIVVLIYKDLKYRERTTVLSVKETIKQFLEILEVSGDGETDKFGFQFIISTHSQTIQTSMFKLVYDSSKHLISIVLVDSKDYHLE